jgi:hypothetical protein
MQTIIAPTWSWPNADPALIEALLVGALEGFEHVPISAGEIVSAEFYGKEPLPNMVLGTAESATTCSPSLRVVMRKPDREIEVSLDPASLGADTPDEAREYAASAVLSLVGTRPARPGNEDDPEVLASGWGFRVMQELTQIEANPDPVLSLDQLRARVRALYGESAETHEQAGSPTGKELANEVRVLVREAKRAGFDLYDIVKEQVTAEQGDRLDGILEKALEVQIAEHALRTLEPGE